MKERRNMKPSSPRNILLLLLTAMIWGSAFVAQSAGMDYVGPYTFLAFRSYLGGAVLVIYLLLTRGKPSGTEIPPQDRKTLMLGGICCGAVLFVASALQQIGVMYTTVSKSGFLTAMYILIVPFLSLLLFRRRLPGLIWVCVGLSLAGMYLLCLSGPVGFTFGDGMVLLCAVGYSVHILVVDRFSSKADPVLLSCIQFFVCAVMSTVPMLVWEHPAPTDIAPAWLTVGYAGIFSSGVGYTLQTVAQRDCDPTICSLVLCLESVFSALFGWLLLGQGLSLRESAGCVLMFAAIVLSQLPRKSAVPG